ncbi:MAG: hypothetical protein GY841_03845 [FCB group bacterium]|nr:hypothetical protein [FCB group bacterium]
MAKAKKQKGVVVTPPVVAPKAKGYRVVKGKSITGTLKGILDSGELVKPEYWSKGGDEVIADLFARGHIEGFDS